MAAVNQVKLIRHSWISQQATSASAQPEALRHCKGCCQAAVNKPASALVWLGSMRGLVPESLASKPAGLPGGRTIESGNQKYVLHQSQHVPGMYPFKIKKSLYKNMQKSMYSVRTGTYWYVTRKFVLLAWSTYFYHAFCTQYVPSTYSSGTLRYYDIIVLLWYHSFDYYIIVNIMPMIS